MTKHPNHDHYWIEDGVLYESYRTIRGLRYMSKIPVQGMPDIDKCDDKCILYIKKEYCNDK